MKIDLSSLVVVGVALLPLGVLYLVAEFDRRRRERTEKPPQSEKLLRPPGYSLGIRLDEAFERFLHSIFGACILSAMAGPFLYSALKSKAAGHPAWVILISILIAVPFVVAGLWRASRAFGHIKEAQNVRLGLRGEQAVAEALNEAADCGFRAFHDMQPEKDQAKGWNIDHITVGPRGIFVIETKARRRRASRNGKPEHVVTYDGKALLFPSGYDTGAIPQAERNAEWLAAFLSKKTAEPVTVEPLVVLPGWYVETKGSFPVKVMNASYLANFLRGQRERISPAQVQRIIAAVDDKCRDLEF